VIDLAKEFTNSICKQVREMILRGEILMVARIVEIGLAENLGVSRTSVREVLRLLTSECLVSFMPNRGYVVISYFSEDVTQIYSCRAWLESEAVRLVTLNSVAGDMRRRLESLVKKAHEGFADRSSAEAVRERFLINNNEFLERLHAGCSNVPLLKMIKMTTNIPIGIRNYFSFSDNEMKQSHIAHMNILKAVFGG